MVPDGLLRDISAQHNVRGRDCERRVLIAGRDARKGVIDRGGSSLRIFFSACGCASHQGFVAAAIACSADAVARDQHHGPVVAVAVE